MAITGLRASCVELRDPKLGRLLANRWTFGAISKAAAISAELNSHDYVATLFAHLTRLVEEDAPPSHETFEGGKPITFETFQSLSSEALDQLAHAYLEEIADSILPPERTPSSGNTLNLDDETPAPIERNAMIHPKEGERESERLQRLILQSTKDFEEKAAKLLKNINPEISKSLAELSAFSDRMKKAFEQVSLQPIFTSPALKLSIGNTLASPVKVPDLGDFTSASAAVKRVAQPDDSDSVEDGLPGLDGLPRFPKFEFPRNPIHETNEHLARLKSEIDILTSFAHDQMLFTQKLADTALISLEQTQILSAEAQGSSRTARFSIWIAALSLVVSVALGAVSYLSGIGSGEDLSAIKTATFSSLTVERDVLRGIDSLNETMGALRNSQKAVPAENPSVSATKEAQSALVEQLKALTEQLRNQAATPAKPGKGK